MGYKNKEVMREYQRVWMLRRRAAFMNDKACVKCGSADRLELDHIDRSQKVHHSIWSWATERREAEIAKCQVLCKACHWEKTKVDMGYGVIQHGTVHAYDRYRCRCEPCTASKRVKNRHTRARARALADRPAACQNSPAPSGSEFRAKSVLSEGMTTS